MPARKVFDQDIPPSIGHRWAAFRGRAVGGSIPLIGSLAIVVHWAQKENAPAPALNELLQEEFRFVLPADVVVRFDLRSRFRVARWRSGGTT
jgi:hypothetical protein